jgi:hypothetical protein
VAGGAGRRVAGHADNAGTKTSGAGGLYFNASIRDFAGLTVGVGLESALWERYGHKHID